MCSPVESKVYSDCGLIENASFSEVADFFRIIGEINQERMIVLNGIKD